MTNLSVKWWRAPVSSWHPSCNVWFLSAGIKVLLIPMYKSLMQSEHYIEFQILQSLAHQFAMRSRLRSTSQLSLQATTLILHSLPKCTMVNMYYQLASQDDWINLRPKPAKNQEIGGLEKCRLLYIQNTTSTDTLWTTTAVVITDIQLSSRLLILFQSFIREITFLGLATYVCSTTVISKSYHNFLITITSLLLPTNGIVLFRRLPWFYSSSLTYSTVLPRNKVHIVYKKISVP